MPIQIFDKYGKLKTTGDSQTIITPPIVIPAPIINNYVIAGSGGSTDLPSIAGEAISSGMAVVIWTDSKIYRYDITNENHFGLSCGIAKTSSSSDGDPITVGLSGSICTEVGSGWSSGNKYYISYSSILTTTAPVTGIIKQIAIGIGVDTILISDYNEFITI